MSPRAARRYNPTHERRLRRGAGPSRPRTAARAVRPAAARRLPSSHPRTLRELHRRLAAAAAAAAPPFPRRLRLLPLGRRPRRRGRRRTDRPRPARAGGARSCSPATTACRPTRSSSPCSRPSNASASRRSRSSTCCRRSSRTSASSAIETSNNCSTTAAAPPTRSAGSCCTSARHSTRAGGPVRLHLHGPATGQLLAGRGPRLRHRPRLSARGGPPPLRLQRRRPGGPPLHAGLRGADAFRGGANTRLFEPAGR